MQLRHPLVVTPEEGSKILCQVFFIGLGERAHNAEVERYIKPKCCRVYADLNIAWVHVRMEKPIPKYLREKDSDPIAR